MNQSGRNSLISARGPRTHSHGFSVFPRDAYGVAVMKFLIGDIEGALPAINSGR